MKIEIYKINGPYAPNCQKAIKIIATKDDKDSFIKGLQHVLKCDDSYKDFVDFCTKSWKKYKPCTDEEKEEFKDKNVFILKIYEKYWIDLVWMWFVTVATAED